MIEKDYKLAFGIGHDAATQELHGGPHQDHYADGTRDHDDLDDAAHPGAFSEALELLANVPAAEISEAVHAGIYEAWQDRGVRD